MVVLPCMLCYCRLLQSPSLAGLLVLPKSGLQHSPGPTNVALATAAGDSEALDRFSIGRGSFTLVGTERSDGPDLKITFMPYYLHTCLMFSLTPAVYGTIT